MDRAGPGIEVANRIARASMKGPEPADHAVSGPVRARCKHPRAGHPQCASWSAALAVTTSHVISPAGAV